LMSDAMEERSVEPRAVPAAEVRDWASEAREERASACARVVEVVVMARRRMVEEESEKRMIGISWKLSLFGCLPLGMGGLRFVS
jgi:hypothetical protein